MQPFHLKRICFQISVVVGTPGGFHVFIHLSGTHTLEDRNAPFDRRAKAEVIAVASPWKR
jgi:hypothetical protein